MTWRAYFSQVVAPTPGNPVSDSYRPAIMVIVPGLAWKGVDGRTSPTASGVGQEMFCVADVTPAQHATLIADARITYLPIEGSGGVVLPFTDPVSNITAANRTTIRTLLANRHIPDDGIQLNDLIRATLRRIALRFVLREILRADDLTEGLDTLVSAIAAVRRQAIRAKLVARGIDFDTVVGTDTVREAIVKLVSQNPEVFRIAA